MDVIEIFNQLGIEYKTQGKNISANHIGIKCPLCGHDDPSEHLGIDMDTGAWSCWRDPTHKGRELAKLISILTDISIKKARKFIGETRTDTTNFKDLIYSKLNSDKTSTKLIDLELPKTFNFFTGDSLDQRASNYLIKRGFAQNTHVDISNYYNVGYCYSGEYKDRIIFIIFERNIIMTWTSRSFFEIEERYKNLVSYKSIQSLPQTLWNYDNLMYEIPLLDNPVLYIVEGYFDALKIDYYSNYNVFSTCLSGLNMTDRQIILLMDLPRKTKFIFVLDEDAKMLMPRMQSVFSQRHSNIMTLPKGSSDPGEMSKEEIKKIFI